MKPIVAMAVYKPKPDKEIDLLNALRVHVPTLRKEGFATLRPPLFLKSKESGAIIEIFEWVNHDLKMQAHDNEKVKEVWAKLAEAAEMVPLETLSEAKTQFPNFEAMQGVVCS
ncbi:hypothetical protein KDL45_16740 [bacterium]|nr:hypothetical protein [bacterium]